MAVCEGTGANPVTQFTVSLSKVSDVPVQVSYATADGTAVAGADYIPKSGTVTLAPGTTSLNLSISIIGDDQPEAVEKFVVTLTDPVNGTLALNNGIGTIIDDDRQLVLLLHGICGSPGSFGRMKAMLNDEFTANGENRVARDYDYSGRRVARDYDYSGRSPLPRDVRKSLFELSNKIAEDTTALLTKENATQVVFVAHSMGGVIVRAMVAGLGGPKAQEFADSRVTKRIIMAGTPNYGTTPAFKKGTDLFRSFCNETVGVADAQLEHLSYGSEFMRAIASRWRRPPPPLTPEDVLFIVGCGWAFAPGGECATDRVVQAANATLPKPDGSEDYRIAHVLGCHISIPLDIIPCQGIVDVSSPFDEKYVLVKGFVRDGRTPQDVAVGSASGLVAITVLSASGPLPKRVAFSNITGNDDPANSARLLNCSDNTSSVFLVHEPSDWSTGIWTLTQEESVSGEQCWLLQVAEKYKLKSVAPQELRVTVPQGRPVSIQVTLP